MSKLYFLRDRVFFFFRGEFIFLRFVFFFFWGEFIFLIFFRIWWLFFLGIFLLIFGRFLSFLFLFDALLESFLFDELLGLLFELI